MDTLGEFGRSVSTSGSLKRPGKTFSSEATTGLWLENPGSSSSLSISKRGVKRMAMDDVKTTFYLPVDFPDGIVNSAPTLLPDGSPAFPSLAFSSGTNSGYYWDPTGTPGQAWTALGIKRLKLDSTALTSFVQTRIADGNVSTPAIGFTSNNSSGFYWDASGVPGIAWTLAGTKKMKLDSSTLTVSTPIVSTGSIGASGDINCGDNALVCGDIFASGTLSCGSITASGSIDCGSFPIFCGAVTSSGSISCTALSSSGTISSGTNPISAGHVLAGFGSSTAPSLSFSSYPTAGFWTRGSGIQDVDLTIDGVTPMAWFPNVVTCSVPFTTGSNSITGGAITGTSYSGGIITGTTFKGALNSRDLFGPGTDGAISYNSGGHTLSQDLYATSITLTGGAFISTVGYRVYCSGTINLAAGCEIRGDGVPGSVPGGGGVNQLSVIAVTIAANSGGNGGASNTGGNSVSSQNMCIGGAGGTGATATGHAGGTGGTIVGDVSYFWNNPALLYNGLKPTNGTVSVGTGGGGGSGGTTGSGGGGGSSGNYLFVSAFNITGAGNITARGGQGGTVVDGTAGVGGGGGGGFVYVQYGTLSGGWNPATNIIVDGGLIGAGGVTTGATAGGIGKYKAYQISL